MRNRALIEYARANGWAVAKTKSSHLRLTHPAFTNGCVITSSTPRNESRATNNTVARMRRALRQAQA